MEEQINKLIQEYEEKLKSLKEQGHDNCYDCCDYTALGENVSYIEEFLKKLRNIVISIKR